MSHAGASTSAGVPGLFTATRWSVVLQARAKSPDALSTLYAHYHRPLLCWLRARSSSPHDAEDLLQGFFAHLLQRDFLENVSPVKGRFRTFLLVSLKNYLRDEHRKEFAAKRGAGHGVESLQEISDEGQLRHDPPSSDDSPDLEFDRAWADAVLANAVQQLTTECEQSGHELLFAALEPVLFADETACSYREIAKQIGMSEGAVKVAAHRVRLRLKNLIRAEILQTVGDERELEGELRYLIALHGRSS